MILLSVIIFILGINIGSFVNVLVDRLPKGETILGRSYCDKCKRGLKWYDLVPLVSFFILGRKCRYCKKEISWQYPIVEFTNGIFYLITYVTMYRYLVTWKDSFSLISSLIIVSGLIVIFFTDLKYRIIPDQILLVIGLVNLINIILINSNDLAIHLLSGLILFLIFWVLLLLTNSKGMGMGDVKYAFFMGFFLGYPKVIIGFYIAFLTGAFISLILILVGKKKFGQTIAFGPFLVVASFIAYFWGEPLWIMFQRVIGLG